MSPKLSLECLDALADVDTGRILVELDLLQSKPDNLAEARSNQEPEAPAKNIVSHLEPAGHGLRAVISPEVTAIQRAAVRNHIDEGLSRRDAAHGKTLRWFAGMVMKHQENVRAQRAAIIAEAVRSGEDPRSGIRNRRLLSQEIAGARSEGLTAEQVIKNAGFEPSQFPALRYSADAFVPSRRRRNVALIGLAAVSCLVFGRGGAETPSTERPTITASNVPGVLDEVPEAKNNASEDTAPEGASGPTTTSTVATTIPRPKISEFQLGLAKRVKIQLGPGTTAEQAAEIFTAVTGEAWNTATVNRYIGPEKFPHPGGEVMVNDCQGDDVDLIREGDTISGIAKDNGMSEQQLSEDLNEGNINSAGTGLCIKVGLDNKGVT